MNRWMRCCALLLLSAMPAYAVETGIADDAYGSGNGYVVSAPGESAELRALARSGSRIIAGGRIGTRGLLLQRYASGRPDFTFSSTGIKALDELAEVTAIAVMPNFDYVVAGWREVPGGARQAVLARYNSSGDLVTSFGAGGVAALPFGAQSQYHALVYANGALSAVGQVDGSLLAARYSASGSPDTSFALVGYRADRDGSLGGELKALHVAADGSMIAVGMAANFAALAIRYTASGDLDSSFDGNGIALWSTGTGLTDLYGVQPGPGGSWWLGGVAYNPVETTGDQVIARLSSTGALDPGFAAGAGFVMLTSADQRDDRGYALALSPDGKPTLAGTTQNADGRYVVSLLRVNASSGALDPGFGDGGRLELPGLAPAETASDARALSIAADGRLLAAGRLELTPGYLLPQLYQRLGNGLPDLDFYGDAGHGLVAAEDVQAARSMRVRALPDGGAVVAGFSTGVLPELLLARFDASGHPDLNFAAGTGQLRRIYPGGGRPLIPRDLLLRPDNRILVLADADTGGVDGDVILYQFLPSGAADSSFGSNGRLQLTVSADNDVGIGLALDASGRVLVYGRSLGVANWRYWLARLQSNGTLDGSFFPGAATPGLGSIHASSAGAGGAMALSASGAILLCDGNGALQRRLADGSPDTGFDGDGSATLPGDGSYAPAAMAVDAQGRIVIGGAVSRNGQVDDRLMRLLPGGAPDLAFGTAGVVTRSEDDTDGINALLVQRNGRILTAGKNYIANVSRYTPTGAPDLTFAGGRLALGGRGVQHLALDPDGGILATRVVEGAGGSFLGLMRIGGDVPLTVERSGDGGGSVLANPALLSCGAASCVGDYATGEPIMLQAQPTAGSVFVRWTGNAGCDSQPSCTLQIYGPTMLSAEFRLDRLFANSFE